MVVHPRRCRSGLTLIDLVVGAGLILFLAALFAPLVFRVRQAAGRAGGQNNLRQIGIAVHTYVDSNRNMPPIAGEDPQGRHGSILYHLLPFIEQQPLHQKGPVWEAGTVGEVLSVYLDPRDKTAPGNQYENSLATTNYAASWLAFGKGDKGLVNTFLDGTSNTIMFTERYQMCNSQPTAWSYDQLTPWAPMFAYYTTAKFQMMPKQADCDPALAQALDRSGAVVLMADASSRSLSDNISPETWRAALTPAGGEVLGNDF